METTTATTDWSAHYVKTSCSTSANTTSARTLYPPTPLSLEPDNSFRLKISPSETLSLVPITDQAAKVATNGLAATFEVLVIDYQVTPADN